MTNNNTYNGWANRETWLVNLYFGDSFNSYIDDDVNEGFIDLERPKNDIIAEIAERYDNYVSEHLEEEIEGLSSFLHDFIDLGRIDWYDLAESIYSDIKIAQ
jgi:hypothetical protein